MVKKGHEAARSESEGTGEASTVWTRLSRRVLWAVAGGLALLFAFVALVDPYDNLAFSPKVQRHRITGNERYVFPGLVRHGGFDSAVFGTSTIMLLDPRRLGAHFGGRFANLGMGSATAWEQAQIMTLFSRHVPRPGTVIVSIDSTWCTPDKPAAQLTFRPFPPWEYDENPWNDYLYLLNTRSLVHAARQLATILGLVKPAFRDDGYFQFVPDDNLWTTERMERELYGTIPPAERPRYAPVDLGSRPASWTFPDLVLLKNALGRLPQDTTKVLMFPPYHVSLQTPESAQKRFGFCKQAVAELARQLPNTVAVDFMFPSPLTSDDTAYWDPLHYRIEHSLDIEAALSSAVRENVESGPLFKTLVRPKS